MDPADARPSMCLVGGSGTGKTEQIKRLLASRVPGLLVDIESKAQVLAGLRPPRIRIGAPIALPGGNMRPPTVTDKYDRLMQFRDGLRAGRYRVARGTPISFIAIDGLMELGRVVKGHRLKNAPVSKTGESNTFRAFDEIGMDILEFVASLKEAASDASKSFGVPPVGIVATCGELLKDGVYKPLLPGNQAPDLLHYQFEVVLRLDTEVDTTANKTTYLAHTVGGETFTPVAGRWYAKAPGGLFPGRIENPDLGLIYKQLLNNYLGIVGQAATPSPTDAQ